MIEVWISLCYSEHTMIFRNLTNEVKSFKDTRINSCMVWHGLPKNLHEERPDLLYIGLIWQGPEAELLLPTTELQTFWTHESHETRRADHESDKSML